ncbi:hypothetical protein SAY86_030253 [Trapa natans]|uniref:WRC domain-containing protein n=1 Tax=Trapa natans TaxID=22666 RepID=A0AAN7RCN2_TRANT|nr:hypothetical protein SAY86_030253 [Trapa natans]
MRIRKRQVGLPLSSLSPVPLSSLSLSDPYTLSASGGSHILPVQLLRPTAQSAVDCLSKNSKRSDQLAATNQPPIGGPNTVDHTPEKAIHGEKKLVRNDSSDSAASRIGGGSAEVHQSSILCQDGRWHEGEKSSSPWKKRRNKDNLGKEEVEEVGVEEKDVMTEYDVLTPNSRGFPPQNGGAKKRGRGAGDRTMMEGSRCSRVNGRGWRCCQQTLVGYSLCEHHLGKGRLRSMMNVSRRRQTKTERAKKCPREDEEDEDDDDEEYVEERKTKKGLKIGVVKARSMSSLLGQADDDNSNPTSSTGATPATVVTVEALGSDNVNKESCMEESMK